MPDVTREEFDALVARVQQVEERQDAHAVVVAAAIQRLEARMGRIEEGVDKLLELVPLTPAIARHLGITPEDPS